MALRVTGFLSAQLTRLERFADADGRKLQKFVEASPERNCVGTPVDVFFPTTDEYDAAPRKRTQRKKIAKQCHGCPVADECLAGAVLRGERYGGWGGVAQPDFQELSRLWRRLRGRSRTAGVDRTSCNASEHGTASAYRNGCRCTDAADQEYQRQREVASGGEVA